jgi:hypothetical protein
MNEGSFSFLSYESQRYQNPSNKEFEPIDSKYNLRESLNSQLPSSKHSMSDKLEIVILLQAAEIERLTDSLDMYRAK